MGLFDFFKSNARKEKLNYGFQVDFHSHLIPKIDDGVKSEEEAMLVIKYFQNLGIKKFYTTPHIKHDVFSNNEQSITEACKKLNEFFKNQNFDVQFEAGAEYFLDENMFEKIKANDKLLTFNKNFLLFETSHSIQSPFFNEAVYLMKINGYRPILAHPERYAYAHDNFEILKDMFQKGVYFQLNINSLSGYYGKMANAFAEKLIDAEMIDFVGSDCHGERHLQYYEIALNSKYYKKLLSQNRVFNDRLL